ncbi:MAG: hypothetical protein ACI4GA_05685 [Acutalibacteraceae bacterium]|nr:hypothetical protein [Oscillospiraceae bacterium]
MKIYSFDGKKNNIDNIDLASSPLFLGQKYAPSEGETDNNSGEKEETDEKQIEK